LDCYSVNIGGTNMGVEFFIVDLDSDVMYVIPSKKKLDPGYMEKEEAIKHPEVLKIKLDSTIRETMEQHKLSPSDALQREAMKVAKWVNRYGNLAIY
jgi:hypothetical protein